MIVPEGETCLHYSRWTRGWGKVRHSTRRNHHCSYLGAVILVLSFLVSITGLLDLPLASAKVTSPGVASNSISSSDTDATDVVSLRGILSGGTIVAADQDLGDQPVPARTEHCPMNVDLTVACPDVRSLAVLAASMPAPPDCAAAGAAAQPAEALPGVPGAPLHPVSLIRLSISRV